MSLCFQCMSDSWMGLTAATAKSLPTLFWWSLTDFTTQFWSHPISKFPNNWTTCLTEWNGKPVQHSTLSDLDAFCDWAQEKTCQQKPTQQVCLSVLGDASPLYCGMSSVQAKAESQDVPPSGTTWEKVTLEEQGCLSVSVHRRLALYQPLWL